MKLWLLEVYEKEYKHPEKDPWKFPYNKAFGFVVRAETEKSAREFARRQCGDEGMDVWVNNTQTSCQEITADGEAGVILRDFNAA